MSIKAINYVIDLEIGDATSKLIMINLANLYNDATELIAVAKLGQPIPKSKTNDMTFVVKFDI